MAQSSFFPAFITARFEDDGNGFPAFQRAAETAASRAQRVFGDAFSNVTKLANDAVTRPLTASGGLDLDAAGLKASAQAAELKAAALRQIALAAEQAAHGTGDISEETRLYVQAARAAAIEAERAAAGLRLEANAAEVLQSELARMPALHTAAGVAANALGRAQAASAKGAAQNRMALVQAGQQAQDFAVQVSAGTPFVVAFSQQIGQLAFVAQGATGALGTVARFLSGPWGLAFTLGASAVAFLTTRMGEAEKSTNGLTDAQRTGVVAADALAAATKTLDDITGRGKQTADEAKVSAVLLADARLKEAEGTRAAAQAELELAKARLAARQLGNEGRGNVNAGMGQMDAQTAVNALEGKLKSLDSTIADARKAISTGMSSGNFAGRFSKFFHYDEKIDARPEVKRDSGGGGKDDAQRAAREAERSARELDQALKQLQAAFDPAAVAGQRYAETLAQIDKLQKAGKLNASDAAQFTRQAAGRRIEDEAKAWDAHVRETFERLGPTWERTLTDPLVDVGDLLEREFGRGAAAAGKKLDAAVIASAQIFEQLLGRRAGGLLNAVAGLQQTTPNRLLRDLGEQIFGKEQARHIGEAIRDAMYGADIGQAAGGLILGGRGSRTGEAIGGAIGQALGKPGGAFAKGLGQIFKPLGDFAGPLGAIAGGLLGGVVGKLLTTTPRASATIGGAGSKFTVSSVTGTSSALRSQASSSADSAISTLERIADQLGATIDASRGSVSIGLRNGKYRVDTSGSGITKTKKGALDFGEDAEAAVKAATLDLIRDGVLAGLRASTQRLLQQSKDLDSAADKALRFEGVFRDLKAIEDPVGAALDDLNRQFRSLISVFGEAGASAEEYADLEKLYGLKRADAIKQASEQMTASLKGLLDELKTGDNGLSIRDRLANALTTYNPLRDQAAAGTLKDFDAFTDAARTVLDIERQLGGSTSSYFDRLSEITSLSEKALADQQAKIAIASATASPFSPGGSSPANDNAPVVGAIGDLGNQLGAILTNNLGAQLAAVNANLGRLIAGSGSGGGGALAFGAERRNF